MRAHSSGRVTSFLSERAGVRWCKILHLTGYDVSHSVRTILPLDISMSKYRSSIRPVVTYGCEAWTLTNRYEQHIGIFERRILRKIFGPVQNEDGSWRIGMNYELNELNRKRTHSKIYKKQKNSLARSRDVDG
jgi:hypothetical protein